MQLKLTMSMANDNLTLGATAGESQWIVKLPGRDLAVLPDVEFSTMAWARNAGFDVPRCSVVPTTALSDVPPGWCEAVHSAFAIERFDRRSDGSKIHQEDLCQALEILPDHKYADSGRHRVSHDGVLAFVRDVAGEEAARELARRVGFTIACGNGDAHLKNWSLLWGNASRPSIAPCYDFVATIAWPETVGWDRLRGPQLALKLGGEQHFSRLSSTTLARHAGRSGCVWAGEEVMAGIARARDAWVACVDAMPDVMRRELTRHWREVPLLDAVGLPGR